MEGQRSAQIVNVLLVAPYLGGSHQAWASGYARHSRHEVSLLALPARFWKWRMQGGPVTLATMLRERISAGQSRPDVVLATDMANLPAFLGLARDLLADVPVALYCHENQLTYPLPEGEARDLTYPMVNWLSMLVADRVYFNTQYHLMDWFEALPGLLRLFPDYRHLPLVDRVYAKSAVLPVGCELRGLEAAASSAGEPAAEGAGGRDPPQGPGIILWNQRWEYDKDPATFIRALDALVARRVRFRVALAGTNVWHQASVFEAARERLGERVIHFGRADRSTYRRLLWDADVVVSTALHEFFGVAVVEAIACGTFPVLPARLSYPELLPEPHHGRCLYRDFEDLVAKLAWALENGAAARALADALRPAMMQYDWAALAPQYDAALAELADIADARSWRRGAVTG